MNKELNKKLAEWAGLKVMMVKSSTTGKEDWECYIEDGVLISVTDWNFTNSLDACFKWLVPKLTFAKVETEKGYKSHALIIKEHISASGDVNEDNPALALCLAIEKLIDSG